MKLAEDLGIPRSKGAWLVGFLSITSTVGRIFFGKLSEMHHVNRLYLYQFSTMVIGLSTALCPLATNYDGLVIYAVLFGFFDGCFVGQVPVITADVVGHEKLSQAVGNMFGTLAIPMSLGPLFAGTVIEYYVMVIVAKSFCLVSKVNLVVGKPDELVRYLTLYKFKFM